jgi:benzoyl-CoA reductase/2-hydroxyglutaryl-CoA dehydratase subunit BcrC/BadD/HgdB
VIRYEDILDTFRHVNELPLSQWRERFPGSRPLGFMNAYVPLELFHAAGFTPVLLQHARNGYGHAQRHLPGFTCWVVRSALDRALAGEMTGWEGVAFGHTCDAVQALADLWPLAVPDIPAFYVAMPHHLTTRAAHTYLLAELRRLRHLLEGMTGQVIGDGRLRKSIALRRSVRSLVMKLYSAADNVSPPELHAALSAAFLMPWEVYHPLLADLVEHVSASGPAAATEPRGHRTSGWRRAPRLVVVGSELSDPTLYQVINDAGGLVVDDMLDLGSRHFASSVGEDEGKNPLEALADHTLALLPTPTKYDPRRRRDQALLEMVRSRRATGVVFARQKFCEPHGFDVVPLRSALDGAGVPHLLVELEQTPNVGQMRTRVEAFLEMIE